jgi:ATP-dependent DNA helicase RecG
MNAIELLDIITSGETSKVQFKLEFDNQDKIAAEIVAMSNAKGGIIIFGVEDKTGAIVGLDYNSLQYIGNKLATIASDSVKPPVYIVTEVVSIDGNAETEQKKVLLAYIDEGISKPYKDNSGAVWMKQGPDKRKLTDNNEQVRLFQQSGLISLDEMIIPRTTVDDINYSRVNEYINKIQEDVIEKITETLLTNLSILRDSNLTLGGLLFFAKYPQKYKPAFCIKAISFFGDSIGGTDYRSSQDIEGTIPEIFEETIRFFTTNLHHVQAGQNFNSIGKLEVSQIALEELLQNALVHRDYSKNAPIRVMIFDNRIEIVSPGSLPNSLTIENIKMGNAVVRNNLLVSYCSKLMTYRGFGSGITRVLKNQSNVTFINDVDGEQFKVIIPRPEKK